MSKQLEWAESYIKRYEQLISRSTSGGVVIAGVESELYTLAQAIVADAGATPPQTEATE